MPFLDALGGQSSQRRQVLRQSDSCDDLRQIASCLHAQDLDRHLGCGMDPGRASYDAHAQGHLQRADEIALSVPRPMAQTAVAARAGGVGVGSSLDGSPVVAGGKHDGVYAVHDPFVVGGCSVRVKGGESRCLHNALDHLLTRERFKSQSIGWHRAASPRQPSVSQIGENPQQDSPTRDALNVWGKSFASGVDCVSSHSVATIDDQVDDHHRSHRRGLNDAHV